MRDELVIESTAKMAAKKGFKGSIPMKNLVTQEGVLWLPTQSGLQRWLREKHERHIEVKVESYVEKPLYYYSVFGRYKDHKLIICLVNSGDRGSIEKFDTYEKALEVALFYTLNQLEDV